MGDMYVRLFIGELRKGKSWQDAAEAYCWARCVYPVDTSGDRIRDIAYSDMMCFCEAFDAFNDGLTDDNIRAAFSKGAEWDREHHQAFRATEKHERPSSGQLIRSMSLDDQMRLAKIIGFKPVAEAVAGKG